MKRPFMWAIAAAGAAALWLVLVVALARGGSLAGLYYTGQFAAVPPQLAGESIWRVPLDRGYDGQFYHYLAHDPLMSRGIASYVDNPPLRWRRILLPAAAYLLAVGNDRLIDPVYVLLQLAFTALGAWWLSRLALLWGRHPAWGLAFLLVPAVLVSLDRMTTDLALAALTVGFVLYAGHETRKWPLLLVLLAAPLVRETGALLIVGFVLYGVWQRRWRDAAMASFCILPAVLWWAYVAAHTAADRTPWLAAWPFAGLIDRTVNGVAIPRTTLWLRVAGAAERLALTGLWAAVLFAAWLLWRRRKDLLAVTAIVFMVFAASLGKADIWADAYAAGRTMTPLLLLIALIGLRDGKWWYMAPAAAMFPRIALQYQSSLRDMLRGLL